MSSLVTSTAPAAPFDIDAYLARQSSMDLLRFITCGSVDDGKSTLIGRLLYESKSLFEDQLESLRAESQRFGTQGDAIDFALLVDGLSAEREQGITIDVAYRFFQTDQRKFIVADTPGHEQYTRNMVTGASTAEAAVILIDATLGVLTQTRRHAYIAALLGVRHLVLAVNKMDLVGYSQAVFERITAEASALCERLGVGSLSAVPLSALRGDNVVSPSAQTPWYTGEPLLRLLERLPVGRARGAALRFPVQWVNRPDSSFRGVSGTLVSGEVRVGDAVRVLPSREEARVARIVTFEGDLERAVEGQAPTIVFDRDLDASRGDVVCAASAPCALSDTLNAQLVWMHEEPGLPGRAYTLKIGALTCTAHVTRLKHKVDINNDYLSIPASALQMNDVANVDISLDRHVPFDPFSEIPAMGSFILIDRLSNATVAAGMIQHALRRGDNLHYHQHSITAADRAQLNAHKGRVVWLTGLSGSGKSTVADQLERQLHAKGVRTYLLDGDNVRQGLNKNLGFSEADRVENIRRVAEVARLMRDAGLVVLVAFISPFRVDREQARALCAEGDFIEVFVDTPIEVCESRDPKGLYKKARAGLIPNFTGVSSPYEPPLSPEVHLTADETPEEAAARALARVTRGLFDLA